MSTDEQMAAIGRLVTERTTAKREQSLLNHKIQTLAENLTALGGSLRWNLGEQNQRKAVPLLDDLLKAGGLEALKSSLSEYNAVTQRLAMLEDRLKDAGV
jgi:hypothetical protein